MEDLKKRVDDFNSLRLPGQPFGMHMGTSYLVNDLWEDIQKRDNELRKLVDEWRNDDSLDAFTLDYCADELEIILNDGGE